MSHVRVGRALLVALATGSAIMAPSAAAAGSACPASTASVVVHVGGSSQVVTAAELCPLVSVEAQYETRAQPNTPAQASPFISAGIPVTALLQYVGFDPSTVSYTGAVRTSDGTWSTLDNADLTNPTFADGLVPVVEVNGDEINYVRPLRSDPTDTNANDEIDTQPGVPLQFYAGTGPLLTVTATAHPSSVKAGQPVSFTASSTPTGDASSYSWTFSDGGTAVGSSVHHTFTTAGEYDALVLATGADGSGGEAPPVYVTVGSTPPSPPVTTKPSPGGGSSPPSSPRPGPTSGSGTSPSSSPSPQASASASGAAGSTDSSHRVGSAGAQRATPQTRTLLSAGELPLVRGRLIGAGEVIPATAVGTATETGVAPAGRTSAGRRALGAVGASLAIMLLFAAGVARESRWRRRSKTMVRPR